MQALRDLLKPERLTAVVDVGANPVEGHPPYRTMLEAGLCTVVGFEPIVEALGILNGRKGPNETYLPYILGDGEEHTLHLTRRQGMVSLLKPDPVGLGVFERLAEYGHLEGTMATRTVRLDDLAEVPHCDLIKLDIQGGELSVLKHAPKRMADAVMVITEMSFMPLYKGQPTLGVMDGFLRGRGFVPHCFAEAKCWPLATEVRIGGRPEPHQLLEADMVYVRDFTRDMEAEQWKHLAMLAHHMCGSFDLAMLAIENAARVGAIEPDAPLAYAKLLGETPR